MVDTTGAGDAFVGGFLAQGAWYQWQNMNSERCNGAQQRDLKETPAPGFHLSQAQLLSCIQAGHSAAAHIIQAKGFDINSIPKNLVSTGHT